MSWLGPTPKLRHHRPSYWRNKILEDPIRLSIFSGIPRAESDFTIRCPTCSQEIDPSAEICTECGNNQPETVSNESEISWESNAALARNPFMLHAFLQLTALSFLGLVCFCWIGALSVGLESGRPVLYIMGIAFGITLFLIFGIGLPIVALFGWGQRYRVSQYGVVMAPTKKARNFSGLVSSMAIAGGVAEGDLGLAGAGMQSSRQKNVAVHWEKLKAITLYPKQAVIYVSEGLPNRMYIFCNTRHLYQGVLRTIFRYVSNAEEKHHPPLGNRLIWIPFLIGIVLTVVLYLVTGSNPTY
jgi:hypothetical protein